MVEQSREQGLCCVRVNRTIEKEGGTMSDTNLGAARAKADECIQLSPLYDDETLDWDVPPIEAAWPFDIIRARVVDVEA